MIDLNTVNWRKDRITERYVCEYTDILRKPRKMKPGELGDACTYCETNENPYAEELMRRAGNLEAFQSATTPSEKGKILRQAAKAFGFMLY